MHCSLQIRSTPGTSFVQQPSLLYITSASHAHHTVQHYLLIFSATRVNSGAPSSSAPPAKRQSLQPLPPSYLHGCLKGKTEAYPDTITELCVLSVHRPVSSTSVPSFFTAGPVK